MHATGRMLPAVGPLDFRQRAVSGVTPASSVGGVFRARPAARYGALLLALLCSALTVAMACDGRSLGSGRDAGSGFEDGGEQADARPPGCGNGLREPGEACDGTDLGPETCLALTGLSEGDLACLPDCTYDVSDCFACGDGVVSGGEACDGTALAPGTATCEDLGLAGQPTCASDCRSVDYDTCTPCGNGLCEVDLGESAQACPSDCGWTMLALSKYSAVGVRTDGSAWVWGDLIPRWDAPSEWPTSPLRVDGIDQVTRADTGEEHRCAVRSDGSVWCWGLNGYCALGSGPMMYRQLSPVDPDPFPYSDVPVQVPGVFDASDIVTGPTHSCALTHSGEVFCWGSNYRGELGLGTTDGPDLTFWHRPCYLDPVQVPGLPPISSLSASKELQVTCAATGTGEVYCWGDSRYDLLGLERGSDPATCQLDDTCHRPPVQAPGLSGVTTISYDFGSGCAVSNGRLFCWFMPQPEPQPSIVTVSSGAYHRCVVTPQHEVLCRGANDHGELGIGSAGPGVTELVPIAAPPQFRSVHLGYNTSCAIDLDHVAWCWGGNTYAQCGIGAPVLSIVEVLVPTQMAN